MYGGPFGNGREISMAGFRERSREDGKICEGTGAE